MDFQLEASGVKTHRKRVLENEGSKILWEFSVPNLILKHNKSDMIIVDKVKKEWHIIYVACSFDA